MDEPTDAEISDLYAEQTGFDLNESPAALLDFARAVLAKWGTPPAVAPWRSAVLDLIDDCPGLTLEQDRWLSRRVKELDFASTPQPTQAQAGAVPLTNARLQDISLNYSDSEDECTGFRDGWRAAEKHHGIKGGQHGADT